MTKKRRTRVLCALLALGALLAACIGESDRESQIGRYIQALEAEEESANDEDTEATIERDVTPEFVRARWENVGAPASSRAKARRLSLENVSEYTITTTPVLICNGLIRHSAEVELGRKTIEPGAQASFVVPAAKLPIQTNTGTAQAILDVRMAIATPKGPVQRTMTTRGFYYQHNEDYSEYQTFTQKELAKNGKVHLSGFKQPIDNSKARVVGRITNNGGGFDDVTEAAFAVEQDGVVIGYESGLEIEAVSLSKEEVQ